MKTLDQIRDITDLDARIIHASALLEFELRKTTGSPADHTLRNLIRVFEPFQANRFIEGLNSAITARNAIAHCTSPIDRTEAEKARAADYLIRAVQMVQLKNIS